MAEETQETPATTAEENEEQTEQVEEPQFDDGEDVVIREDFHSKYFQGLQATIVGPGRRGKTGELLWTLKLEQPPHEMVISGKYLRRPSDGEIQTSLPQQPQAPQKKGSFLTRIIPWRRS